MNKIWVSLALASALALLGCGKDDKVTGATGAKGDSVSKSSGTSAASGPSKLTLTFKSDVMNPKSADKTLELDVKKAVIVTTKTKVGDVDTVTHTLMIANHDFDPKDYGAKENGHTLVEIELYAAKDAAETTPVAAGTYEPIANKKEPAMKIGSVTARTYSVEDNAVKNETPINIATFGMREGSIKINSVTGNQVQGSIDDYGAPGFNKIKGAFTATVVK